MKKICIALIRFYQKHLSGLKRHPTCRFTPTCSAYAICAGGYDPVPERGFRRVRLNGYSLADDDGDNARDNENVISRKENSAEATRKEIADD